jgi:integrase
MPRSATGELRHLADGFAARITIEGRDRRDFVLATCKSEEAAAERKAALAKIAARLRRAGHVDKVLKLIETGAKVRAGRPWDTFVAAIDVLCSGTVEAIADVPTFADFAKDWTDGKLTERFPDHVPKKDHDPDERFLRLYVNPHVGSVPLNEFTFDDAELVMANVPDGKSASTRRHIAQVVRRVLGLAVYPARHIKENPIPRGWLPKVKQSKAFTYLYPEEDRALLASADVSLVRRLFFGVLAREGMRRDELGALRWRDLDTKRGHVMLDENKTDDPRSWALDSAVARALRTWKESYHADAEPDALVFREPGGVALYTLHLADDLRRDLHDAGVKRPALFERSDVRRPIRVHDLRATFVTVSLANGRTETWVADRTGHRSSVMINRYRRAARTWAELALGPLAPLDEAIPELRLPHGLPHDGALPEGEMARKLAEREGFEPSVPLRVHMISNHAPSTTRSSLLGAHVRAVPRRKRARS